MFLLLKLCENENNNKIKGIIFLFALLAGIRNSMWVSVFKKPIGKERCQKEKNKKKKEDQKVYAMDRKRQTQHTNGIK